MHRDADVVLYVTMRVCMFLFFVSIYVSSEVARFVHHFILKLSIYVSSDYMYGGVLLLLAAACCFLLAALC